MPPARPVLIVAGPTASGKSALALDAAREFDGVVINADSMQVYRELRVLTARPTPADEARVPHRLYGVMSAAETCSAGQWLKRAVREIEAAGAAGRLPIVVGGTGLYLKALIEGINEIPEISESVRREARERYARLGGEAFRAALAEHDPQGAARLAPSDRQRLVRAFEVARATGRPLSAWQAEPAASPLADHDFAVILVDPPRERLYAAIDARFEKMLAAGALDEARRLSALGLPAERPALKALGVAELIAHVQGEIPLDQAVKAAQQATRRYAKRQLTWFRNQLKQNYTLSAQYSESLKIEIFSFIRNFLLTRHN